MEDLSHVAVTAVHRDTDIMLVHNLVKKFTRNLTAVKGVSFGVAPCECFGLLGVNGAGKTTIFRMLTGDEIPTEGEAWIGQYSLSKDKSEVGAINIVTCSVLKNHSLGEMVRFLFSNTQKVPKHITQLHFEIYGMYFPINTSIRIEIPVRCIDRIVAVPLHYNISFCV